MFIHAHVATDLGRVSTESLACIRRLHCERLQTHIVVSCLHKSRWTIDKCLQILPLCERRLQEAGDRSLLDNLTTTIRRMSVFHRIMLHALAKKDISIEGCPEKVRISVYALVLVTRCISYTYFIYSQLL